MHDCYEGIVGSGNVEADILVVGHAPGPDEWKRSRKPMTGPSGRLMDGILEYVDIDRANIWVTNLLCHPNNKPTPQELTECMPRFLEELEAVRPKVIVALGDIVTELLVDESASYKFSALRGGGWWSKDFSCWVIPTYHTAAYLYEDSRTDIADGVRDFKKIKWYLDKPKGFNKVEYDVAGSQERANLFVAHQATHVHELVACDIETTYATKGRELLAVGFSCEHGTVHIPTRFISQLEWGPLRGRAVQWGYHGGMFDSPKLREMAGIAMPICEDSLLQSYSLDERGGKIGEESAGGEEHGVGIHGLKKLAREYQAAGFYEKVAKGRIDKLSPEEMADYNSHDVAYTYRNIQKFKVDQVADGVRDMYFNILIPAANVHSRITARGAHVSRKAMNQLKMEWIPRWLDLDESLHKQAAAYGLEDINLQSPMQLAKLLYDEMGAPMVGKSMRVNARTTSTYNKSKEGRTTNMYVLKMFAAGEPAGLPEEVQRFSNDLLDLRGLTRDIQNYITGIEDDMDDDDMIHPEPDMHGTRVGRLAYKKPPIMTIPKARTVGAERARIRSIFAPKNPKTHVMMEADFRQAELYAAHLNTGDQVILDDLNTGDFHAQGAQDVFKIRKEDLDPVEWDNYRDSYKIIVYGSFYGATAPALMGDKAIQGRGSSGNYHLLDTRKAAQKAIDGFNNRYKTLFQWREEEKKRVVENGEQQNHNGRKRRYYLVRGISQLNQAINFPISSLSHDHLMVGWTDLGGWDWSKPAEEQHDLISQLEQYDSYMLWEIHDSVVLEVRREYVHEVAQLIQRVMSKPRFGFEIGIPVDIKVGNNWLDVMNLDKWDALERKIQHGESVV